MLMHQVFVNKYGSIWGINLINSGPEPQTIRETMNDIDAKLAREINAYFEHNPGSTFLACADSLGCDLSAIWAARGGDKDYHKLTVLNDKQSPAIQDAIAVEADHLGKTIPTLTGSERDGKVVLPTLHDVKEEMVDPVEKVVDDESEDVRQAIFTLAEFLQGLATNYDYGTEEEYLEAQEFILEHSRELKFLAVQAEQVDGIIDEEELEESANYTEGV